MATPTTRRVYNTVKGTYVIYYYRVDLVKALEIPSLKMSSPEYGFQPRPGGVYVYSIYVQFAIAS